MKKRILSLVITLAMIITVVPELCVTSYAEENDEYSIKVSGVYDYAAGQEMMTYINEERASQGKDPLTLDADLTDAAMQRAAEIAFYFSHTRTDGRSCFTVSERAAGENIALGTFTALSTYTMWKNSSGHYANMMNNSYTNIGIGHFTQGGSDFWVQLFSGDDTVEKATRSDSANITTDISMLEREYGIRFNLNKLSDGEGLDLILGEEFTLEAGMINAGWTRAYGRIDPESFAWSSSDKSVVAVSQKGVVTGVGTGNATITATVNNGSHTKASIEVKVSKDIRNAVVSGIKNKEYTGKEITQNLTVTIDDKPLTENVDYKLEYSNNVNVGTAFVDIIGIGEYSGILSKKFTVNSVDLSERAVVNLRGWDYSDFESAEQCLEEMLEVTYNGETLIFDEDYYIYTIGEDTESQIIEDFGISFEGNYSGSKYMQCIDNAYIKPISNKTYTGSEIKPKFTLYWGDWAVSYPNCVYVEGEDYEVIYENNIDVGTAVIRIVPTGNSYGSTETTFEIVNPKYSLTFKGNGGTVSKKNKVVTYNSKCGTMPTAKRNGYAFSGWYTKAVGGTKVTESTIYKDKSDKTLYAHWKKVTVGKPSVKTLSNPSGKKLKVTVGKITGVKGYQIIIAKNSKFTKGKKTANITTAKYKTFKDLSKTKYYVKVRAYKYDSAGNKIYGKYSKVKTIKIKK